MKKILYRGNYLNFIREKRWEYVRRSNCTGIVVIFPMTRDKKIVLVEQKRTPVNRRVIEFPAGLVNDKPNRPKESFKRAAERELFEETGYRAKKMKFLMVAPANAAIAFEKLHFFTAHDISREGKGGGDGTEDIEVHEVPAGSVAAWLKKKEKQGRLVDPKVYAGIYFLLHNRRTPR